MLFCDAFKIICLDHWFSVKNPPDLNNSVDGFSSENIDLGVYFSELIGDVKSKCGFIFCSSLCYDYLKTKNAPDYFLEFLESSEWRTIFLDYHPKVMSICSESNICKWHLAITDSLPPEPAILLINSSIIGDVLQCLPSVVLSGSILPADLMYWLGYFSLGSSDSAKSYILWPPLRGQGAVCV